jgi:hypothetical protein
MTTSEIKKNILVFGIVAFVVIPLAIPGLIFLALNNRTSK